MGDNTEPTTNNVERQVAKIVSIVQRILGFTGVTDKEMLGMSANGATGAGR